MTVSDLNKKHNWKIPEKCPVCGAEFVVDESSGSIICPNPDCEQKLKHQFERFFDVLDIKGGGPAFIDKIVKTGYNILRFAENCKNPTKNFTDEMKVCAGGINGEKIVNATKEKIAPLENSKLLAIFDASGFDEKKLEVFNNIPINELLSYKESELMKFDGFAEISSAAFVKFVNSYKDKIEKAIEIFGTKIVEDFKPMVSYTFCFTGAGCFPRSKLSKIAEDLGHSVSSSVSSKTSFVVSDDTDSTSAKMVKAKKLGIPVISSREFCGMMNYEEST